MSAIRMLMSVPPRRWASSSMSFSRQIRTLQTERLAFTVLTYSLLVFCSASFAEDTGVFAPDVFTTAIGSQTQADGSDMRDFLIAIFHALDTAKAGDKPANLRDFPYVNGRLFSETADISVPHFTGKARQHLIELGTLNWKDINPDIFGSMFQAVVTPGQRSDMGQHYTSVPNILKIIEPLFLDELKEEFDAAFDSVKRLNKLYDRIASIKVFDPACGSGNFLVIAYKELCRLEHSILERMVVLDQKYSVLWFDSRINIENFYGIEIDDFAVEIAILSMWIAKHQMNTEFWKKFGNSIPLIPLKETDRIRSGNAARLDWGSVCPNNGTDEIYVIGNPRTEELRSCRKGRGKIIHTYLGNGRTQKIWTTLRFGL